jgi:glycosyltransferase involved in cell wall biosynthesis
MTIRQGITGSLFLKDSRFSNWDAVAVTRLPFFGDHQGIVFAEGKSTDGTREEIQRMMEKYPEKDIKLVVQEGRGKGDAVRSGSSFAKGDLLMILDGDLTVPPEDLHKFYRTLADDVGELVNGCRPG